jgi:DNA repair and recombination RAD54-like protein
MMPSQMVDNDGGDDEEEEEEEEDPGKSAKTMFVLDLLQLCGSLREKVLVFSQFLSPFELLEKMLGRVWGWQRERQILKIIGPTSLEDREAVIDKFNKDREVKVLFASIKVCGEGVSLIGASRVVFLDLHWNPAVLRQAVSRAYRIGQTRKVFIYRLVCGGSMEEDTLAAVCGKEWMAKQVFEDAANYGDENNDDDDDNFSSYFCEVDPREVDSFFESRRLLHNVEKCFRLHFM